MNSTRVDKIRGLSCSWDIPQPSSHLLFTFPFLFFRFPCLPSLDGSLATYPAATSWLCDPNIDYCLQVFTYFYLWSFPDSLFPIHRWTHFDSPCPSVLGRCSSFLHVALKQISGNSPLLHNLEFGETFERENNPCLVHLEKIFGIDHELPCTWAIYTPS